MVNNKMDNIAWDEMLDEMNSELENVKNNFSKISLKKCIVDSNGTKLFFVTFGSSDLTNGDNPHLLNSIFDSNKDILKHFDPDCKRFVCYRGKDFDYLVHKLEPLLLKNDLNEFYNYEHKSSFIGFINKLLNKEVIKWVDKKGSIDSLFNKVRDNLNLSIDEVIFVFTDQEN